MSLLTTEEAVRLMFKVLQGFEETNTGKFFFEEWAIDDRIWTQKSDIPTTAPALNDGETSGVVTKRVALVLTAVPGNSNAFYHEYLKDAIPFKQGDGSYDWVLTDNNDQVIPKGQYRWLKSKNSRVLYFYDGAPINMPPKMSFYQYTGSKDDFGSAIGNIPDADKKLIGEFDPNQGLPTEGSGTNGEIKKGDFWRANANGTIDGMTPEDRIVFGDVLFANVDNASESSEFFVVGRNIYIADYLLANSTLLPETQEQADAIHNGVGPSGSNPFVTLSVLNQAIYSLGQFVGDHDASGGQLPTVGSGASGAIVKGDYWRISVAGTITGLQPEEVLASGDVITANADDANEVSEFFSTQGNADFASKADKTDPRFPTQDEKDAMAAGSPSSSNPFLTENDQISTTDDLTEGAANLYYTEARVSANSDVAANTAARHSHTNKAILDLITAAGSGSIITTNERNKLAGLYNDATYTLEISEAPTYNSDGSIKILKQVYTEDSGKFYEERFEYTDGVVSKIEIKDDMNSKWIQRTNIYDGNGQLQVPSIAEITVWTIV